MDQIIQTLARELGVEMPVGNLVSTDNFYAADGRTMEWGKMGVLAVEMEAAALYMNAARSGNKALCICTVSDSLVKGTACTAEQRQNSFDII